MSDNRECQKCGDYYTLRQECEPTAYCDLCAQTMLPDVMEENAKLKARLDGLQKNFDMQAEWLLEWKRVAEALKAAQPSVLSLTHKLEAANAACAEMREALENVKAANIAYGVVPQSTMRRVDGAISTDCGKDYVHRSEVNRLREALVDLLKRADYVCQHRFGQQDPVGTRVMAVTELATECYKAKSALETKEAR